MISETIVLNKEKNAFLNAYIQPVKGSYKFEKRPAVLVIPGGGYRVTSEREGDPIALYYAANGYQAFVLNYTLRRKGGWPDPLKDYEAAMKVILERSEEWNIDTERIAAAGFSAGGHLAACAMTLSEYKPAAAILIYPALLKKIVDLLGEELPYPIDYIKEDNCPCFVACARNDHTVEADNTLELINTLYKKNIPFESHIYAFGGHGFAGGYEYTNSRRIPSRDADWMKESLSWLEEILGKLTNEGFREVDIHRGDPYAKYVSRT